MMQKKILVHLGPHKTATTSIQNYFSKQSDFLRKNDIVFFNTPKTHAAALSLANEKFDHAKVILKALAEEVSTFHENYVILSHEDFSGQLPGRTSKRRIYPNLTKNLRIIRKSFKAHSVCFVFYKRSEKDWLRSCYHQHLKHRTRFSSFDDFCTYYDIDFNWESVLSKPRELLGDSLFEIESTWSIKDVISIILRESGIDVRNTPISVISNERLNQSPESTKIKLLERINKQTAFPATAWYSKQLVLKDFSPSVPEEDAVDYYQWPPSKPTAKSIFYSLPALLERSKSRVSEQMDAEDILPNTDVNLVNLSNTFLPRDVEIPEVSRRDMRDQDLILRYHLRGKSMLAYLNALVISYLRRNTKFTSKARFLFHRIWQEQGMLLINEVSTRWLISTLQTFYDHGLNEAQRSIGSSGYFYANLIKIYEGERAIEGNAPDTTYEFCEPQTKNGFRGLDRYRLGGTDLLLNTNTLLYEASARDQVAGMIIQEFLLRVQNSHNVFTRNDRSRAEKEILIDGFEDTWSFFEGVEK